MGFESLKQTVMRYPPEEVAKICGVGAGQIREAARILGMAERLLSTVLQGFYQSMQATAAWSSAYALVLCSRNCVQMESSEIRSPLDFVTAAVTLGRR